MEVPSKPDSLRVVVFIDGQNFYSDCRDVFGHGETHPHLLGREICKPEFGPDRLLKEVRFYTGIHTPERNVRMNSYMQKRLAVMKQNEITVFSRPLKYSQAFIEDRNNPGHCIKVWKGREKGVDVRIALDMVMMAFNGEYEIASLVSRDSDLDEAIRDVYKIREITGKWLAVENVVCVPPVGSPLKRLHLARRPIKIDHDIFDRIRDDTNYRTQ